MKITVFVKPNSKKGPLLEKQPTDDSYIAYINESPIENKVNDRLIKIISKQFKVPKTKIKIAKGQKSKHKIIEIEE